MLHVDRTGGDEGVDTPRLGWLDRCTGAAHVILDRTRQRTYRAIFNDLCNRFHRFEIARAGRREACLDNIHAQFFQLAGNADFHFLGHRRAGTLFAIAQSGIKNYQFVHVELQYKIDLGCGTNMVAALASKLGSMVSARRAAAAQPAG